MRHSPLPHTVVQRGHEGLESLQYHYFHCHDVGYCNSLTVSVGCSPDKILLEQGNDHCENNVGNQP
jgi:hypothetical protein